MKSDKIVDALNHIDDKYILEAKEHTVKSKHVFSNYKKPAGIIIACVCVGTILLPNLNRILQQDYSMGMSKTKDVDTYQNEITSEYSTSDETTKKIARDASLSLETKELNKAQTTINKLVKEYNAKITSDSSYSNYDELQTYSINIEVPADSLDTFIDEAKKIGTVTYYSQYSTDLTDSYIQSESKLESLEAEKKRVLELYNQAQTMDELIQIEQRLSEIQYEIDYNNEMIEYYDNDVTYSSLSITIMETYSNENIFKRIGHSLKEGLLNFTEDLSNIIVTLAYYIWFILAIVLVGYIVKKIYKKYKK